VALGIPENCHNCFRYGQSMELKMDDMSDVHRA
jgi:hypothetical protein